MTGSHVQQPVPGPIVILECDVRIVSIHIPSTEELFCHSATYHASDTEHLNVMFAKLLERCES